MVGGLFRTKGGFYLKLKVVPPFIFHDLEEKYNIYRPQFKEKFYVEETGATLEFPYSPPVPPPQKGEEGWELYVQYLQWREEYQQDIRKYEIERAKLALGLGVKIIKQVKGKKKINWRKEMYHGDWINSLASVGIDVNDKNRRLLFIRTVVLEDGEDYLKVLNQIVAKEVTLGDVLNALDYFLGVMERCKDFSDSTEFTRIRQRFIDAVLGDKGSRQKSL